MQDDSTNPDVVEIDSLLTSLTDAVRTGDGEALTSLLSDDPVAIFTGSTGRVVGSESVRDVWLRHLTSWNDVELKRRETVVRIHGDVAWATFLWDGVGGQDGETYRVNGERWSNRLRKLRSSSLMLRPTIQTCSTRWVMRMESRKQQSS